MDYRLRGNDDKKSIYDLKNILIELRGFVPTTYFKQKTLSLWLNTINRTKKSTTHELD